ncbi:MAG: sodium/glutamate symporter [Verrucomicrobia bacterium]|nr:sodium/glutamate symporter [Verrucomicrobiota bacterium]
MLISAWWLLLLSIPVLLLGEFLVRRISFLSKYNIPAPVVGGLLVSFGVLFANLVGVELNLGSKVAAKWWTWLVTTEIEWAKVPNLDVHRPFLVAFFTCIGLNASWDLAKRGGLQVFIFLGIAAVMGVLQNVIGLGMAKLMGAPTLLGLVCGSTTMTGGHATALGFAGEFEKAGFEGAGVIGAAAATFGLIAGGLIGGPVGGGLIRKLNLKPSVSRETHLQMGETSESGIWQDFRALAGYGTKFLLHVFVLLVCIKLGSWISYGIQQIEIPRAGQESIKLVFPVYMGALLLGVAIRNIADAVKKGWLRTEIVDTLGSVTLGIFLAIAMMGLNLKDLAQAAMPMLVIVSVQVIALAAFTRFVTFRAMGRDFDAAVMAGGHCGFGLGATPNAVANMKALVERYGSAPRAFLVVPIVGAFLHDFVNAMNITFFLNAVK